MIYYPKSQNPTVLQDLNHEKSKKSGTYGIRSVWKQLRIDFFDKCYICGNLAFSPRIEHFRPHNGGYDKDKYFDWNNLMLACEHCNSIKSNKYTNLIDCTKHHPDHHIKFLIEPIEKLDARVIIEIIKNNSDDYQDTKNLLLDVYTGSTDCKKIGAGILVTQIMRELNTFDSMLKHFIENQNESNMDLIKRELNKESTFPAFKRWYVRNNTKFKELFEKLIED
ncbi:HNH endonuclease [Vibrio fluvialis]|nr:HNH endonuclease [Vibrio fluvialis]